MGKRILAALLFLSLTVGLGLPAYAVEAGTEIPAEIETSEPATGGQKVSTGSVELQEEPEMEEVPEKTRIPEIPAGLEQPKGLEPMVETLSEANAETKDTLVSYPVECENAVENSTVKQNSTDCITLADSSTSIKVGEYITLGKYYDEPILWRCVAIDENGPLMLSDKILCLKAFDAKGNSEHHYVSGAYNSIRKQYGSNCYADSNIRQWLNSKDTHIAWTHDEPSNQNVSGGNPYNTESGFLSLSNFSDNERNCMKKITRKVYTNMAENTRGVTDGGSREHESVVGLMSTQNRNYTNCFYMFVTDAVFIPDLDQLVTAYYNLGNEYIKAYPTKSAVLNSDCSSNQLNSETSYKYWIAHAGTNGYSYEWVNAIAEDGICTGFRAWDGTVGVRPAFYLDESVCTNVGRCGDNLTWLLVDGTLTITGTGEMYDYGMVGDDYMEVPWSSYANEIVKVDLKDGVGSIGNQAFMTCSNVSHISVPSSVSNVGNQAFNRALESITFEGSVPQFEENSFLGFSGVVCYPGDNATWLVIEQQNYGGHIIWEKKIEVESRITLDDTWYFKNISSEITVKHYQNLFGVAAGSAIRLLKKKYDGSGGHCYGMVTSAICSFFDKPSTSSYTGQRSALYDVSLTDVSSDTNLPAEELLHYAQIYQFSFSVSTMRSINTNNIKGLYDAVYDYLHNNGTPVEISIDGVYKGGRSSHALLALSIEDSEDYSVIGVYDCNYPGVVRPLYLYKVNGRFTSWRYRLFYDTTWGTGLDENKLTYTSSALDVYDAVKDSQNPSIVSYQVVTTSSPTLKMKSGSSLVTFENGVSSNSGIAVPISFSGVVESEENESSSEHSAYWINTDDNLEFFDMESDSELMLASGDNGIGIKTTSSESRISINVAQKDVSTVSVDAGQADEAITLTYYSNDGSNALQTVVIDGITDSVITSVKAETGIDVSGLTSMTIRTENDIVQLDELDESNSYRVKIEVGSNEVVSVTADTTSDGVYDTVIYSTEPVTATTVVNCTVSLNDPSKCLSKGAIVIAACYENERMIDIMISSLAAGDSTVAFDRSFDKNWVLFFLDANHAPLCGKVTLENTNFVF